MIGRTLGGMVIAAGLILTSGCGGPEKDGGEAKTEVVGDKSIGEAGAARSAVLDATLSSSLREWARAHNHPAALALAGEILKSVNETPMKGVKMSTVEGEPIDATPKTAQYCDPASLLDEAKKAAEGNAATLAAIDSIGKQGVRSMGATQGPKFGVGSLRGRTKDKYEIGFTAGEVAEVSVIGDGDSDLDLYIYDSDGGLVAKCVDGSDRCYLTWRPTRSMVYRIEVHNLGKVFNKYEVRTN